MRVLVVEDDDRVARALTRTLRTACHDVERVTGVASAAKALAGQVFDVALVDLGLGDGDGIDVIRLLRDQQATGVLAVTARGAEHDRVRGLRAGADDYLVKPFGAAELLARIDAVTRRLRVARAVPTPHGSLHHGALAIDLDRLEATIDGQRLTLARKEFEVLAILVTGAGTVVSREHLLDQVWESAWRGSSRSLDTHMTSLRSKLAGHVQITTIRGVGYRLEPPAGS